METAGKGSLSEKSFIQILKDAARNRTTGMVRIENGPIIKVVYLHHGTVAFASSNDKNDRLTQVLRKAGKLNQVQVDDALSRVKPTVSLGKTLVELGYISARELLWGARAQVEQIVYQLLLWQEGYYHKVEGTLPKEIITLDMPISHVIYNGIMKTQNRRWILEIIGSPEALYALLPDFQQKNLEYRLPESGVIAYMNGKTPLNEIAHATGHDAFDVCKIAVAFELLDLVGRVKPAQMTLESVEETSTESAGDPATPEDIEGFSEQTADIQSGDENISLGEVLEIPSVEELQHIPKSAPDVVEFQKETAQANSDREGVPEHEPAAEQPDAPSESEVNSGEEEFNSQPSVQDEIPEMIAEEPEETEANTTRRNLAVAIVLMSVLLLAAGWYYLQTFPSAVAKAGAADPASVETANIDTAPQPAEPTPDQNEIKYLEAPAVTESVISMLERGELAEAALQSRERFLLLQGEYTIQLLIACREETIRDVYAAVQPHNNIFLLPLMYRGRQCYRIVVGRFASMEESQAEVKTLPDMFTSSSSPPAVVPVSRVVK